MAAVVAGHKATVPNREFEYFGSVWHYAKHECLAYSDDDCPIKNAFTQLTEKIPIRWFMT